MWKDNEFKPVDEAFEQALLQKNTCELIEPMWHVGQTIKINNKAFKIRKINKKDLVLRPVKD